MHLICVREELALALALAERGAAARENVPVLSGVLISAGEGRAELRTTDLEMSISASVNARVEEAGARVVDARLFSGLVRRLGAGEVEIRTAGDGRTVEIQSGGARFSLVSMPADDFPDFPELNDGWRIRVPAGVLESAIGQSRFAAASSDQRPVLSGVLLEVEGTQVRLVATDSSRLSYRGLSAEKVEPLGNPGLFSPRAILPARALEEMQRICGSLPAESAVEMQVGERLAALRSPSAALITRLIEGNFPPYQQVFLEDLPRRVRFKRQPLLEAIQRAALLSRRGPAVVQIQVEDGEVVLRSTEADVGEGEESVEAAVEGPPFQVAYQARFLEDVLKAFDSEEILLELGDPTRQGTVKVPGDAGYRYIVMPVRLG